MAWNITGKLGKEDQCRKSLSLTPVGVSNTNHKNLATRLVTAKLEDTSIPTSIPTYPIPKLSINSFPARNIPCRKRQCATCPQLSNQSEYYSYQTKKHYTIKDIYSCDTTCAIYLLQCLICSKQYIGETGTTIRNRPIIEMPLELISIDLFTHMSSHMIFKIIIIDKVTNQQARQSKESEYIELLKTKLPFGLNVIKKTS